MKITKTSLAIVIAMTCAIALMVTATTKRGEEELGVPNNDFKVSSKETTKRFSRFLAQEDPRPKFQCNKDADVCHEEGSTGSTCCNNKCIDIITDNKNCGACKNKCKYTEKCCNGKCVDLNFDKRHCGTCGNKCMTATAYTECVTTLKSLLSGLISITSLLSASNQ